MNLEDILNNVIAGMVLLMLSRFLKKNHRKMLLIRNSISFLVRVLRQFPNALIFEEDKREIQLYAKQHQREKQMVDRWIDIYFWKIQRPFMVWIAPPALAWVIYFDSSLMKFNTPLTYVVLCASGLTFGILHDWAKPTR